MSLALPNDVCSSQDLKQVISELKSYAAWYRQATIKVQVGQQNNTNPPVVSSSTEFIVTNWTGNQQLSAQTLETLINDLTDFEATAPFISITLAALPSQELKTKLVVWCRQNIASNTLVNFHYRSNLFGGMVVRYRSHIFDWSFRRQIMANLSHFPEVLRHV